MTDAIHGKRFARSYDPDHLIKYVKIDTVDTGLHIPDGISELPVHRIGFPQNRSRIGISSTGDTSMPKSIESGQHNEEFKENIDGKG